jgi:hypothetical protein
MNLARYGSIDIEPWWYEHQVRAFALRRARRHRRAHAEGARLVARRGDNPALCGIADGYRAALQGRIIALLDWRIEGVHIHVDDFACVGFAHGKSHLSRMGRKTNNSVRTMQEYSARSWSEFGARLVACEHPFMRAPEVPNWCEWRISDLRTLCFFLELPIEDHSVNFPHSPPSEPGRQPTSTETASSKTLKFSKKRLALAFAIAGLSDVIGAFATLAPPIVWTVDVGTRMVKKLKRPKEWITLQACLLKYLSGTAPAAKRISSVPA